MGDKEHPPGGGILVSPPTMMSNQLPDQRTATPVWTGGSVSGGNTTTRTFEQILQDEKKDRNILEIQIQSNDILNSDG